MTPPSLAPSAPAQARAMAFIRDQIEGQGLREGDPLPSETAISRELSVSRGTVRSAFSVLQQKGLIEAGQGRVRRVRRVPTRAPRSSLMRTTVVVASAVTDPARYGQRGWDTHTQAVFTAGLRQVGYHVLNLSPARLEGADLDELLCNPPGALVLCPSVSGSVHGPRLAEAAQKRGVAVVAESDDQAYAAFDRVVPDHAAGSRELVHWLASCGRRHILPVFRADADRWWVNARLQGYSQGVSDAGLEPIDACHVPRPAGFGECGREAIEDHINILVGWLYPHVHGPRPVDAVMAPTDQEAPYIAAALEHMGLRVNEDVDLVGYDAAWSDDVEGQINPNEPLATIDKQNQLIGETIAEIIASRLGSEGEQPAMVRRTPPQLLESRQNMSKAY
ncbi:MAG: substrate-binding domain-containing protein [Planctomycetota bacterium]